MLETFHSVLAYTQPQWPDAAENEVQDTKTPQRGRGSIIVNNLKQ